MIQQHDQYEIDDARTRFDMPTVRQWLATTYWWAGTATPEAVARAFDNSLLIVGAYHNGQQVGCCRVVTDLARFAWLADVYVVPEHRKRGLAKAITRYILQHPECKTITRFLLITRDAHDIYKAAGFQELSDPERWMQFRPPAQK